MISEDFLRIMIQKEMDKEAVQQLKKNKRKEKQEKTLTMLIATKRLAEKKLVKQ
jgi:hypothetical protein